MQKLKTVFASVVRFPKVHPTIYRLASPIARILVNMALVFGWPMTLSTTVTAQTSIADQSGFWTAGSTWSGGTMPGTLSSGTITLSGNTAVVDGTVTSMYSSVFNLSNVSINAGDTLVVFGNLDINGSLLTNNGVLIVYGNVKNTLSSSVVNGTGKMVVTGSYTNALGSNVFTGPSYVFGSTSGFFTPPAVGNASTLQSNDGTLYDYVQDLYGVLPIELISFEASIADHIVTLTWSTATEVDNEQFVVERSSDGLHYRAWKTLPGSGQSKVVQAYTMKDANPLPGRSYYRLNQVDFNGQMVDLEIVTIYNDQLPVVDLYPNPTADFLYFSGADHDGRILLSDIKGISPAQSLPLIEIEPGKLVADLRNLNPGVYVVQYTSPSFGSKTFRVTRQ